MQGKFGQALSKSARCHKLQAHPADFGRARFEPHDLDGFLLPAIKPNLSQSDQIQIIAADLTDAYGRPIDGNDDGVPGGNYVAIVTKNGVTPGESPPRPP